MLVVAAQATFIAYLYNPRLKGFVLSLPIPFSLAYLSVGNPVDITNVLGLLLFFIYTHAVRWLHQHTYLPIIAAIAVSTLAYAATAACLVPWLPKAAFYFWLACGCVAGTAVAFQVRFKAVGEKGYRTELPVWIKFAIITGVIFVIILIKKYLQGFMTLFPMVSVVALYEARFCLRTICRQMGVVGRLDGLFGHPFAVNLVSMETVWIARKSPFYRLQYIAPLFFRERCQVHFMGNGMSEEKTLKPQFGMLDNSLRDKLMIAMRQKPCNGFFPAPAKVTIIGNRIVWHPRRHMSAEIEKITGIDSAGIHGYRHIIHDHASIAIREKPPVISPTFATRV